MAVIHILRDGTRVDDIKGHVVRMADNQELYQWLAGITVKREPKDGERQATESHKETTRT